MHFNYYCIKDQPTKFYYTLIEQYEEMTGKKYCTRKHIFEDKPKKKEKNMMFLPLEPATAFLQEEFAYWEHIQWGLDNDIEIWLDYSWEFTESKLRPGIENQYFWFKHKDYLIENNIKILSQHLESTDNQWPELVDPDLRKITHNLNMFEFNMRINHERNNIEWRMSASPRKTEKRKYFCNFIPGEIRKYPATLMLQALFNEVGKENVFYSTVLGDYFAKYMMTWDDLEFLWENQIRWFSKEHQALFLQCLKNAEQLHKHFPFEDQYDISSFDYHSKYNSAERRIPMGVYDSHFSIVAEVSWASHFFTEKTFKHIIAEQPFIISAGPGHNHALGDLGYLIYDELFDYQWDNLRSPNSFIGQDHNCIIDNVKRLWANKDLFNQPSLREKTQFNRQHLLRKTSVWAFEQELKKVLES